MISIRQAVQKGIARIRRPIWANPFDHLEIPIIDGALGPWIKLWAPFNKECNGRDPVSFLSWTMTEDLDKEEFEPYTGPLPDSDEYKAEVEKFAGVLQGKAR